MKKNFSLYTLLFLCLLWVACKNKAHKNEVIQDTTINPITSFNNLFLDSVQLQQFISKHPEDSVYRDELFNFYKQRNYEYAWFDTSGIAEQAGNFMNLLNTAILELNDSNLYNKKLSQLFSSYINDSTKHEKGSPLETELLLTAQFFKYAAKVYKGEDIDAAELGWFIPRKKVNVTALLDSVINTKGEQTERYSPLSNQYKELKSFLVKYNDIQKNNSWDSIAKPAKVYKLHDSSEAIAQIKKRLFLLGDMSEEDSSMRFDTSLLSAVKSYQKRMGLSPDGVIGSKMMDELNYPISERIKQILINLERVRWMPPESDSNYILVNIPEYKLHVFDSGHKQFDMNVIVGTAANNTVIFTGNLKYIVFSPYWNVPQSIVEKEILPSIKKDPDYLEKNDMEITSYTSNKEPVVRQKPGPKNSLGNVKFLFPNNFNIYLHDTPNHDLFTASSRSFSHGCIRIADPTKMALYLLRDDTTWTPEKVDSCMHLEKEKWVTIKDPVRVFIGYFTAWVNADGKLNFRKDIYGHDAAMADKLFVKR
ncbi:MAG: L,D-transpeptidase family protein [Chitinophagaceae bacterium]